MNGHKKTLSLKLNLATIGMILAVAVGVLYISFQVYSSRLKAMYCRTAEKAAASAADLMNPELIENIIRWVETDEFREIREKAVQAEDPEIIKDWLRTKPTAAFSEEELEEMREDPFYEENQEYLSLIFDYDMAVNLLDFIRNQEDITYVYVQYMKNGVTMNLLETEKEILLTGTVEEALPEFAGYGDNERVPATIYRSRFGWLCSAYEPLVNPKTGEAIASVGVDIDMTRMVRELTGFLVSCDRNRADMFVTVWIGILDIRTGVMTCANAGHEYPAVLEADGSCRLFKDKHGFVLGGMEGMEYRDYEIRLKPGAGLMVYTDGVTEATRKDHTLYGTGRLIEALNGAGSRDPENLIRAVRRDVDTFVDGAEQFDDMTMLCVVYHGAEEES